MGRKIKRRCLEDIKVPSQENKNNNACIFAILANVNCAWKGSPSEIMDHVRSSHPCEEQKESGPFAVQLKDFSKRNNFHKAISMRGKLFYLLWLKKYDTIHFLVYVIPKQTSEEYVYDIKLKKGKEQIAISGGACGNFSHRGSEVLETGDIVRLHCRTMQNYVEENDALLCVIEIRKKEATPSSEGSDTSDVQKVQLTKNVCGSGTRALSD
jgi:hypothetical protein